jgi:hypothetical protein
MDMNTIRCRGGSGVGDSFYLYPIVKHLLKDNNVTLCCNYPEIFTGLHNKERETIFKIESFRKTDIDMHLVYSLRKKYPDTNQYKDILIQNKLPDIPLEMDWNITNDYITNGIVELAEGKKICFLEAPHEPFARTDGFALSMVPNYEIIDKLLEDENIFSVQIGRSPVPYKLKNIDYDLVDKTSISEMIDIASISDIFLGQIGFILPLSECLNKKNLVIVARKGLNSHIDFIKRITPTKVLCKDTSHACIDDEPFEEIQKKFRSLWN